MGLLLSIVGVFLASFIAMVTYIRLVAYPMFFVDLAELVNIFRKVIIPAENLKRKGFLMVDVFESRAKRSPDNPFILYKDETHTYGEVERASNRVANFIRKTEIVQFGGVMGVFMHNEPDYISTVISILKLGVTAALLNIKLRGGTLLNCIRVGKMRRIICGHDLDLIAAMQEILPKLQEEGVKVFMIKPLVGGDASLPDGFLPIDMVSPVASSDAIPRDVRKGSSYSDAAFFFYTSGTTGTPKAARFTHGRLLGGGAIMQIFNMGPSDVLYIPLPLFHSAGMVLGVCNVIMAGSAVAITRNFSASHFWDDVRRYKATVIQYIGEICRYLLAQPKSDIDGKYGHIVRVAFGNGLAQEIWQEFKDRFNIKQILEFFAASEGNSGFFNLDGTVGAVGRYSPLSRKLANNVEIIECDWETAQPIRGQDGKCIILPKGKVGLLLTKVTKSMPFDGYVSAGLANKKKIVHNVRVTGDQYFNTGDLLLIDDNDYVYFKDRIGDTFRWKGENVASCEVASALSELPFIDEAIVYGVKIPGYDGRAGMVAIVLHDDGEFMEWKQLYDHVANRLPLYACPKFLRVKGHLEMTVTYKYRKVDLVNEGFEPGACGTDNLFVMDTSYKTYVPLDRDLYTKILSNEIRLP